MPQFKPVAIIDIGSNSVRLVIYSGATRTPSVLFNEKVMAGLGRGIDATGMLSNQAQARALGAMSRFKLLIDRMGAGRTRVFATAAVREAANGEEFLAAVRRFGFEPEIISGEEEGRLAGYGVLSGIPDADGVIGDLGGGSLELAQVSGGQVGRRVSLPLGVLRLAAMDGKSEGALLRRVTEILREADFAGAASGRPFYMVGGSWRALARLDLDLTDHPLPVTHQHVMAPDRPRALQGKIADLFKQESKSAAAPVSRFPTLPHANTLLRAIVDELKPSSLVVSAYGIREGLLYDDLEPATRALDPLIEAAREVGAGLGRFAQHGDLIDQWIAPIFGDEPAAARLRLAACLLSDIAWAAHPDFRAERGLDMALHGNWVAIDAPSRVMLAQAMFATFGGGPDLPQPKLAALCSKAELERARQWGLAIRLAQRLSAGLSEPLVRSSLALEGDRLVLWLPDEEAPMFGESVERRLKSLAGAIGKKADFLFG
jgi:exopolyphosphatase/guanosine-5'-triphosphate,3'-diphosphate pyrophosphatase